MAWFARLGHLVPRTLKGLLLLLATGSIAPLLLLVAGTYWSWYETRMEMEFRANREYARAVAENFVSFIRATREQAGLIGAAIVAARWDRQTLTTFLEENDRAMDRVGSYTWVSPDGTVLASSNPRAVGLSVSDRPYFQELLNGQSWSISNLIRSRAHGEYIIVLARAVQDKEARLQGVVVVEITPGRIESLLTQTRTGAGTFTIFDKAGRLVFRSGPPTAGRELADPGDPLVFEALRGKEVDGEFRTAPGETTRLGSRVPIGEIGWVAGASRPKADLVGPVYKSAFRALVAAALVLLTAATLAMLVNRRILRGVEALRKHAALLGAGQLEHRVDRAEIEELAELARSFNRMADEITNHQRAIEQTNRELLRSNRDLEAFSYSVSHDLRAPLRAIDGFSLAVVEDYSDKLDEEGRRLLTVIRTNAQRLEQLIDDLLAYSRVGRKPVDLARVNVERLVREVFSEQIASLGDKPPVLEVSPLPTTLADRTLLRQAFANLIGNAVKFTHGRPDPRIRVRGSVEDGETVYSIEDNGVGFDMRYVGKLFGVFQRLHGANEFEGTGVGLAIVEQIIKRHGGRVWAEGEVNRGATFHFALPHNQPGETA